VGIQCEPRKGSRNAKAKCIQCVTRKASRSLDFIPRRMFNIQSETNSGSGVMPATSFQASARWTAESPAPAVSPTETESEDGLAATLREIIQFLIHTTEREFERKLSTKVIDSINEMHYKYLGVPKQTT